MGGKIVYPLYKHLSAQVETFIVYTDGTIFIGRRPLCTMQVE